MKDEAESRRQETRDERQETEDTEKRREVDDQSPNGYYTLADLMGHWEQGELTIALLYSAAQSQVYPIPLASCNRSASGCLPHIPS